MGLGADHAVQRIPVPPTLQMKPSSIVMAVHLSRSRMEHASESEMS
jgi:hypothetical protein